jgi:hypothetical protein
MRPAAVKMTSDVLPTRNTSATPQAALHTPPDHTMVVSLCNVSRGLFCKDVGRYLIPYD